MLKTIHAAGQYIYNGVLGGGTNEEKDDEEDVVDLDTSEDIRSEEPGTYWSEDVREYLDEVDETRKLPREPKYRSGNDTVTVARPSPTPSRAAKMPQFGKSAGRSLGFKPHDSISTGKPGKAGPGSSFKPVIKRQSTYLITSEETRHFSDTTSSYSHTMTTQVDGGRSSKRRKTSPTVQENDLLDFAMTGLKQVQQSGSRPRSASDTLETQRQQVRRQHKTQRSKSRDLNEDETRGDGFNTGLNADEGMNIKPVMTQNGLSPSVPSQTISGSSHDSHRATSSKATKSKPRDRGGTSRSISRTLNVNHAGDAEMEDVEPALPLRHKKNVISKLEHSEAGQAVGKPENDHEFDGNMMERSEDRQQRDRKKIALLHSFYDVYGNQLCDRGTYIYMNSTLARFEVLGQSSREPITVPFSGLLKYTTGTAGNGVACMLEGSKVQAGSTAHMDTYWVGLIFTNHDGLSAFEKKMAIIGSIKHFDKAEDTIKKTINKKWFDQVAWRGKVARTEEKANTPNAGKILQRPDREQGTSGSMAQDLPMADTLQPNTPKLRDQMHGDDENIPTVTRKDLRSSASEMTPKVNGSSSRPHNTRSEGRTHQAPSDTDSATPPPRATRSSGRASTKQTAARQSQAQQESYRTPFRDTVHAACPWKSALLYPSKGPGRATVEFADLERLDDEAYLNDNLISFGLRYLQEKFPASKGKVYIFNSFFYNTLAGKGRKDIDYDAVKRWTSKIDLFSYDHVVVPINAGMHWYWAIICNIRNVFADSESDAGQDSMVDEQAEKLDELSIAPEHEEAPPRAPRKNDPTVPTIVTLDSLHNPHSPVVGNLKKYVMEEARNKKGKEVDQSFIKGRGMTSKEIPSQQNLTDCGLHLIITIGELLRSPDEFVAKLVGKSFDNEKDFAGWEYMSEYREHWKMNILEEYNNQTGGDYFKEVAKAKASLDHARKLKEVEASKANPPFKTPGRVPPTTNTIASAPSTRQRSVSPSRSAQKQAAIHTPFKTPLRSVHPIPLAKAPAQDLSSESDEDMSSAPIPQSTTKMQSTQSAPSSSHITDNLLRILQPEEIKDDADNSDFVPNSQPEAGTVPDQDEDLDELEIVEIDAQQKASSSRHDSRSPAKQAVGSRDDLMEQDRAQHASTSTDQEPTTPARIGKKARKSPNSCNVVVAASQDVEQPPLIAVNDHLNNLVRSLGSDHATQNNSRLGRANDNIFQQPLPYVPTTGHEDDIVLEISDTQDSDELGEPQTVDDSGLLGASNGGFGQEVRKNADNRMDVVDVEKLARAAEGRRHETKTKEMETENNRRYSPIWPGVHASPRPASPEL